MTYPGAGTLRLVRAAVLTGLVVALTLLAHRLGGGASPAFFGLAVLTVLLWPVALLATRRRLGAPALVAGLGAGQLLGHTVLGWLASSPDGAVTAGAQVSLECLQHAAHQRVAPSCFGDTVVAGTPHTHASSDTGLLMFAAHVLATLVAALLVARGEQVLWRILELVLRVLPALVTPVGTRRPRAAAALLVPARAELDVRTGRGPPAYAA